MHLGPSVGDGCPFCLRSESVFHLFLERTQLKNLFLLLERWFSGIRGVFSLQVFIFMPKYTAKYTVLFNFFIWNSETIILEKNTNVRTGCSPCSNEV